MSAAKLTDKQAALLVAAARLGAEHGVFCAKGEAAVVAQLVRRGLGYDDDPVTRGRGFRQARLYGAKPGRRIHLLAEGQRIALDLLAAELVGAS